jgi:hypothetical protein
VNYNRIKAPFRFRGVNLNCSVDNIPADQLGIATNARPTQQGTLGTRPAIAPLLAPSSDSVHSLKSFTAEGSPRRRFSGSAANLYMDNTLVDTGYSRNPLSFAVYQPSQAVKPFLYVADSARYSKIRASDGARFNVGIVPPAIPPESALIPPLYAAINDFDSSTGWVVGGTLTGLSAQARVAAGTVINKILYDSGSTGWACVAFTTSTTSWLEAGARIIVGAEYSVVQSVEPAGSKANTTISAIRYDAGTTGLCCVVLQNNTLLLERDSMLSLGSELVRILSVAQGEDNTVSFRCFTSGAHAAGETVSFYDSARMWFASTHASGDSVTGNYLLSGVSGTPTVPGVGTLTTTGGPLDLTQINGRPVTPQDYMHISIATASAQNITRLRIMLDTDSAINDFLHNYYYADVANDLIPQAGLPLPTPAQALTIAGYTQEIEHYQALGLLQTVEILQARLAQYEASINLNVGVDAWSEILIPMSTLVKVGTDPSATLAAVKAIRIEATVIGDINLQVDSWWIGGTYGPNAPVTINTENPIKYSFRYRSTITGAQSTWSPLNRGGVSPQRQGVQVFAAFSADPQVDTIDFARVGGSVNGTPQFLGSTANTPFTLIFLDDFADAQLGDQIAPGDNQPWPLQQYPIVGTCNVVGTTVFGTSVTIPTNLCEGTIVVVGGVATVIRGLPTANSFQVEDNLDTGTGVQFQIGAPTTFGNPLPYLAGPFDECFFAMGDPVNPTRIYFTNRTNPDTAATSNFVTLPTNNAGMGVAIYNGYVAAMTAEEFIIGTTTGNAATPYAFATTSVGCGIMAPWSYCVGPVIFFWTRNGISTTDLGPAKNISADDLYPYMPHEGVVGGTINGYAPPTVSVSFLPPRLSYCKNGWFYFDFTDTNGNLRTLAYDITKPGWWFDCYTPAVTLHYQDETSDPDDVLELVGCVDGTVQQFSLAAADTGGPINVQTRLGANNFGDFRTLKQAIDLAITIAGTIGVTVYVNSWGTLLYTQSVTGVPGTPVILPIAAAYDPSKLYLDFAVDLTWSGPQQAIEYDLGYLQNPLLAADFVSNPTTLQFDGYGHVREVILNSVAKAAMTANLVIGCEFPGAITIPVTIPFGAYRQYIPLPPNKGMLYEWSLQGSGLDMGLFACDLHVKGWREQAYRLAAPFVE